MRSLLALALLLGATAPAAAQSKRETFACSAEATGGGLRAVTQRLLDGRGTLRSGTTSITLPLAGTDGSLIATFDVRQGLPEVARGKYAFRLPAAADAGWQLAGARKPIRSRDNVLAVDGEQFAALLAGGAPIKLVLTSRKGQERARATLDRATFDTALDLVRQADARALSRAYDYRSCPRGS
ncbi:hypothetical protein GGQ97_000809 [Sphingomonas kaistensis]|uniref:Uncharacterized protein n=1 Tax=Sphingomonas kaistensis TaxID=298708 RepID=A0A7X6BGF6_9SPHN|nr:hypothetical protein [Sphingomonas kaistensis]NJC05016.1 hypothetical protein [Sphingomonas kaistensis]